MTNYIRQNLQPGETVDYMGHVSWVFALRQAAVVFACSIPLFNTRPRAGRRCTPLTGGHSVAAISLDDRSDQDPVTRIEHPLRAISEDHCDLLREKSVLVGARHQSANWTLTNQIPRRVIVVQSLE
jgi:hypothetical protein